MALWGVTPVAASDIGSVEQPSFHVPGPVVAMPIATFGNDERRLVGGGETLLRRRIGLIRQRDTGKLCTAFCLATDIIATAGHCLAPALTEGATALAEIRYQPDSTGRSEGFAIRGSREGIAHRNVLVGARNLRTRAPINAADDWAVVKLEGPACPDGGFALDDMEKPAGRTSRSSVKVYNISYHRDFGQLGLAVSGPCDLAAAAASPNTAALAADFTELDGLRLHDCDTGAASSGSPLVEVGPNGVVVVAMNIGTYVRSHIVTHDGDVVQRLVSETIANTAVDAAALRRALARSPTD